MNEGPNASQPYHLKPWQHHETTGPRPTREQIERSRANILGAQGRREPTVQQLRQRRDSLLAQLADVNRALDEATRSGGRQDTYPYEGDEGGWNIPPRLKELVSNGN